MKKRNLKVSVMIVAIAMLSLFLTTNVHAAARPQTPATLENISDGNVDVTTELTISGEKTIGSGVKVKSGGKLTITGTDKITLSGSIFVDEGGELIIDATDVTAKSGIASVVGKMTVGPNANITDKQSSGWSIYASNGGNITLKGKITSGANIMSVSSSSNGTTFHVLATNQGSEINKDSNIEIESGKFSDTTTIKPEYIANGAELNEDGTVTKVEESSNQPTTKPDSGKDKPAEQQKSKKDDTPKTGMINCTIYVSLAFAVIALGGIHLKN